MVLKCRVCSVPTKPPFIFYCDEHYQCADCGTRDGLVTRMEGALCDPCHAARVEKRIADFKDSTHDTFEAICPHCGYEHRDSFEMSEGDRECSDCGRSFDLVRNVSITYSTSKS